MAPSVTISEMPRKIIIPASVTMNDDTPTLATHTAFHAPSTIPASDRRDDGEPRVPAELDGQRGEHDADQGHRRADREVEVAGHDQHHGADRREPDDRRLQGEQAEVALRQEQPVGEHLEHARTRPRRRSAGCSCAGRPAPGASSSADRRRRFEQRDGHVDASWSDRRARPAAISISSPSVVASAATSRTSRPSRITRIASADRQQLAGVGRHQQQRPSRRGELDEDLVDLGASPTSTPRVGSSRIRIGVSATSQRATWTFCWLPPLSVATVGSLAAASGWRAGRCGGAPRSGPGRRRGTGRAGTRRGWPRTMLSATEWIPTSASRRSWAT